MTKTITVDHLGEATRKHSDAELGTILLLEGDRGGVRRTDRTCAWRRIVVETVNLAGGGPYQDLVTTYEVTFEGGCPAATTGWELAYATFPPLRPDSPYVVYSSTSFEERSTRQRERVKLQAKAMLEWEDDVSDGGPRGMGRVYLSSWTYDPKKSDRWKSTYVAVVVKPNMS